MQGSNPIGAARRDHPWERCKAHLATVIPSPFYESFIDPIEPDHGQNTGEQLRLFVPTEKLKHHIQSRYFPIIEESLRELQFAGQVSLTARKLRPAARPDARTQANHPGGSPFAPENRRATKPRPAERDAHATPRPSTIVETGALSPDGTENPASDGAVQPITDALPGEPADFVAHSANAATVATLLEHGPPSPLYVVTGPAGSGKSHLAACLARAAAARGQSARYLTIEDFLTEFSLACRNQSVIAWRRELRQHSLLLLDDLQFLKKTALKSQEELRHLMDEVSRSGRHLVMLSDVHPRRLPLGPDLQGRLYLAGHLALHQPDPAARSQILKAAFARARADLGRPPAELPDDLVRSLCDRISGDTRRTLSLARRLALLDECTSTNAERCAGDLLEPDRLPASPERVLEAVAEELQVSPSAIRGPARDRKFATARHLTAYLCTEVLGLKLTRTAEVIGRKEHGSVIHARKKILRLMEQDLFFRGQVEALAERIRSG